MATTLYFALSTASTREPGTYPTTATNYANVTPDKVLTTEGYMLPYKWRAVANLTQSSVNRTTAQTARFGRFFSAPFATNYTYQHPVDSTTAIKYFLADYESNLSSNHCIQQCHIYVWRPSTGTKVGTIQPVAVLATSTKEPTAVNSIQATLGQYFQAAGTINILAGDVLVFEPFATFTQGAATAYTIRFYYGGATDITTENTVVATPASKVVFSVDLPLLAPIGAVSGSLAYNAIIEQRGAALGSYLRMTPTLQAGTLVDGSPLATRAKARASASAALTTQTLLSSSLKSISKITARRQQTHEMHVTWKAKPIAFAMLPNAAVGDSLYLCYSGLGSAENPTLSLGGRIGEPMGGQTFSAAPLVPGFRVLATYGLPAGTHTVRVDAVARSVSLILIEGLYSFSVGMDDTPTVTVVGSSEGGFVVLSVDPAAVTSATVVVTVASRQNTLFMNPSAADTQNGRTTYRCLYLFNGTDQDALDVTLAVASDSLDTLGVASEFVSDTSLSGHGVGLDVRYRATDHTGWGGIGYLGDSMQYGMELSSHSLPFLVSSVGSEQSTDGTDTQIPQKIDDDVDSGDRVSSLSFTPSLFWSRVPARRGVSFWVRKVQPPGPGGNSTHTAIFTITADY